MAASGISGAAFRLKSLKDTDSLARLGNEIVSCRACPRLVAWREESAAHPPRRFQGQRYWGRPVPGFGDAGARLLVVGLAPAANGGNRTGRVFTGDASGDFLFAALHRAGIANQPSSVSQGDGLRLRGAWIAAAVRCAPPENKPTPAEFSRCRPFLVREIAALPNMKVVLALGAHAWRASIEALTANGSPRPKPIPAFAHGAEAAIGETRLLGSYHVSQQNTFTGRLTPAMFDAVLERVRSTF
ncbi:MAG: uracil-DNA glycosylase [Acidobacteriota bacterium]|nr:uracil-DNA glycosylase [Acidobacteriota bacterium]